MEHMSMVQFHKYPRRLLLTRRTLARIPAATGRYIHRSAGFAMLMGDLGLSRIGEYVQMMEGQAATLREMGRSGTVDSYRIAALVEAVKGSADANVSSLNLVKNSLTRFLHANGEEIIRPRMPCRHTDRGKGRAALSVPVCLPNAMIPEEAAGAEADDR